MENVVDTYGWHTIAAITYADVNTAIQAGESIPSGFSQANETTSVNATFGSLSLTLGGSGPLLQMQLTITGGTITGSFGTSASQTLPIATSVFPIMVNAVYVVAAGSMQPLVLNGQGPVTVSDPASGDPTGNFLADSALKELLQTWLTANLNTFNVIFASVDIDAEYVNEGLSWLTPSYKGYAVAEPLQNPTLDNSIFAVLCLIDGEVPPTSLAFAVSPYAIPSGACAAFILSADKYLQHMMMLAMMAEFAGIASGNPTEYFIIDNDGMRLRNTTPLTLNTVQLDNGRQVNPTVDASNFTISVDGTRLVINVTDMSFTYSPGIDMHVTYTGYATLSYDATHQILELTPTSQGADATIEVSLGIEISEWVTGAFSILAGLVSFAGGILAKSAAQAADAGAAAGRAVEAGVEMENLNPVEAQQQIAAAGAQVAASAPTKWGLTAARWLFLARVGSIVGPITSSYSLVMKVVEEVAQQDYGALPKITDLTSSAVGKTVIWPPAVGTFVLGNAQLNGALQFGLKRTA